MAHGQGTVKPPLGERIGAEKRGCMPHIAPLGKSAFPLRVHRTDG